MEQALVAVQLVFYHHGWFRIILHGGWSALVCDGL